MQYHAVRTYGKVVPPYLVLGLVGPELLFVFIFKYLIDIDLISIYLISAKEIFRNNVTDYVLIFSLAS